MKFNTLKRTMAVSALGLAALLGTSGVANAQNNRQVQKQQQKVYKQQQKVDNQRAKLEQQRIKLEQERIEKQRIEQQRAEQLRIEQQRRQNQQANRYRINRNGRQYQVDNRQADLLKQAVNMGYQQGFRAGQTDKSGRRGGVYSNSSLYKNGNYGYQTYVDSSLYQYYFRQGFQRGYEDGYNSRRQYGNVSNGNVNILGTILQGILNLQSF